MSDASQTKPPVGEPVSADGPVAVFDSIHAVLAAERAFLTAALACDLVPIPRGVASDCGLALLFRSADIESARALLAGPPLGERLRGIFVPGPNGYTPDTTNAPRP
jgi:hypothetical protein